MRKHPLPSPDRILGLVLYDAERGVLISRRTGKIVGQKTHKGYVRVYIGRAKIRAHHIVWFLETGKWPEMLDHINGDRSDNRISNLREASPSENAANSGVRKNNRLGIKGVSVARGTIFRAKIQHHGRGIFLGNFRSVEEASAAYADAAKRYYGKFSKC